MWQGNHLNPWTVVTKEEFRRDWDKLSKHEVVIVDEAHYFSGMKSQMSKSLSAYLKKHKTVNVLLLTATPYLSTPWNIYVLAKHLGHNWNWYEFKNRFFYDRYIGRRVIAVPKDGIEEEIAKLVQQIGDVVKMEDCADIPDQVFEVESFDLTKEQEKAKMALLEPNPAVRYTKYHQIENGTLKGNEYEADQFWPSHKEERLKELALENKKMVVVCRYNLQVYSLATTFKEMGKKVFVITGETTNRDMVVNDAEAADEGIVVVNAACSEGYELPSFPLMVFASLSFSYKDYKQMLGRILRINKLKKNVYLHLVGNGVDRAVFDAIMNKKDFDIAIYARDTEAKE